MTDGDDTLRMLEDAARGFAAFDAKRIRSWREQKPGFDRDVWKGMAEQGWFSILFSEEDGGLGLGIDAAATVAQQLGRACAPEPYVSAGIVTTALLSRLGRGKLNDDVMSGILDGSHVCCVAWQGVAGGLSLERVAVQARQDAGEYVLSGDCRFVPVAYADSFLVAARAGNDIAIFVVPAKTNGLVLTAEALADGGAWGWLKLSGVRLAPEACLSKGAAAEAALIEAIDLGVLANCAELYGNMERSLELTLEYLKTRKQFGQTIGSFQVLQHRAVDLWMKQQVTRHALDAALKTSMSPNVAAEARARATSSAKSRAADVALFMANECVQLHGAIGFTDEYDLALYVNRALVIAPFLGNAAEHRQRYGDLRQRTRVSA
ncbi:MAG TPA: acyl-CoA dehydrogenase family protein [Hyphomicrobiaceae bacterium]|nr:acyl-CoA dehydrogenase family protein [Hyphomicrobiaceae bacterium]